MIMTIDVGNTNIVMGVYEGKSLLHYWRMRTDKGKSSDEFGMFFISMFNYQELDMKRVKSVMISSVVPPIMYSLEHSIRKYFRINPVVIEPGMYTGLDVKYENPREVGADRIVNAVAAHNIYGGSCIIVDFGTATTFCAVTSKCEYLGGIICPGIKISTEALFQYAAKLPRIELSKPDKIIGRNTVESMQSGMVYGYVGQVDYIVNRMKKEMQEENIKVIATGGLARLIAAESETIDEVNGLLTLEGLRIIHDMNKES